MLKKRSTRLHRDTYNGFQLVGKGGGNDQNAQYISLVLDLQEYLRGGEVLLAVPAHDARDPARQVLEDLAPRVHHVLERSNAAFISYGFTMCPGSSDPFYIVTYYIIWVITSWTYSMITANMDGAFVYLCLSLIINNVDLDN